MTMSESQRMLYHCVSLLIFGTFRLCFCWDSYRKTTS
ncbi:unnamed protein product [Brassica rapa subsp. narinosa]